MVDFTNSLIGPDHHKAAIQAAYERGLTESADRIKELEDDRQAAFQALVMAVFNDDDREAMREKLKTTYGITEGDSVLIIPEFSTEYLCEQETVE